MGKKGFSLVELSMVLLITALLTAGVITSSKLSKQAEIKQLISDVEKVRISLTNFYTKFGYMPGDFPDATDFWTGTGDGDGDGNIEFLANTAGTGASEVGRVFQHMSLAEVYPGSYNAGNKITDSISPDVNITAKTIRGGLITVAGYTDKGGWPMDGPRNNIGGNSINVIKYGGTDTTFAHANSHLGSGLLNIEETVLLDKKIDDGLARSGKFTGHNDFISSTSLSAEQCLEFSVGSTHSDTAGITGGASYKMNTTFPCNGSFDTFK